MRATAAVSLLHLLRGRSLERMLMPSRAAAVAFGGERVSKGETELKWALFEAPTQMQKMQGRGRALFRKT